MTHSCGSDSHNASLLIIDDQRENVELLVRILKDAGFTRITASTDSGRLAELHFQCHPDIVLLDLHMPGQDGFDVLRRLAPFIMGDDRLPVIMITGDDSTDVKRKALFLGARDFISKPFDQPEVVIRIKNLLETRLFHQRLMQQKDDLEKTVAVRMRQFEESQVDEDRGAASLVA
jgi:putative two-component system response regulator